MSEQPLQTGDKFTMAANDFDSLFVSLIKNDYKIFGPTIRDGVIVCDELKESSQLPVGWTEEQEAATYRLKKRFDDAYFGYTLGPQAWKRYLHVPLKKLWSAEKDRNTFQIIKVEPQSQKKVFLGVRPCELAAIAVMDKTLLNGPYRDQEYAAKRADTLIIAVNCAEAGGTCFCVSMKTGPVARNGFDLALTEVLENGIHCFVIEIGSDVGAGIMSSLKGWASKPDEIEAAENVHTNTARNMGRQINTDSVKELLERNHDNPRWDNVAKRCLSCANCTLVCPTCFCTSVEDTTDLTGKHAERWQKWDSCYTADFSYIHGGSIRVSTKSRYRQWATHKFASWKTQFDTFGCIGCGRCITWCPAAIDITSEINAIRDSEKSANPPLIEKEK